MVKTPNPNANLYRTETDKKIYMVRYEHGTDTYDVIQGTKTGVCRTDRHTVVEGIKGRTAVQEATVQVATLLKAKIKSGYKLVKGDLTVLDGEVEKIDIANVELAKAKKARNKAKAALAKVRPSYEAKKTAYEAAQLAVIELEQKLGIDHEEEPEEEEVPEVQAEAVNA